MSNNGKEQQESIGALWSNTSKAGKDYFTGNISIAGETVKIVGFYNDKATADNKQPVIRLYESKPLGEKAPF